MKEQLSAAQLIGMFVRRWWILALSAITLSVATFFYAQFIVAPLYRTDGTLYVSAKRTQSSDITQTNMLASQQLATTYKEILSRRTFLSKVAEDVGNRYTITDLAKMISIAPLNGTEIMGIRVVGEVPEDVYEICHSILTHASDELTRVVNAGSVKILDDGQIPEKPFSPNVKTYALFAFGLGAVIGALIVFCIDFLDTRIKSRDDVVNRYKEPLLGEIPELTITYASKDEGYVGSYKEIGGGRA